MKITESRNKKSEDIHIKDTKDIIRVINEEDCSIAFSVKKELNNIALAVDLVAETFNSKGKLFFIGAGTSGRLGIIQAAECPPTFSTNPDMIQGIIAGGKDAVFQSKEGCEDIEEDGYNIIKEKLSNKDILIGISASGSTPFVIGALKAAKNINCKTISVSCNKYTEISKFANVPIEIIAGPEVITGSTRMKSGTAQKMVLDMITTSALIKTGRVKSNYMTHLKTSSKKLKTRAIRILSEIKNIEEEQAKNILEKNNYNLKEALEL